MILMMFGHILVEQLDSNPQKHTRNSLDIRKLIQLSGGFGDPFANQNIKFSASYYSKIG